MIYLFIRVHFPLANVVGYSEVPEAFGRFSPTVSQLSSLPDVSDHALTPTPI